MTTDETTSVLIAGGGYAGLSAALFLAHQGVDCVLVDRHAGASPQGRARGINARTMEIFRSLGIADDLKRAGAPFAGDAGGAHCETLAGDWYWLWPPTAPEEFPDLSPGGINLADQQAAEPVLIAAARARGAVHHFDTHLETFTDTGEHIEATVRDLTDGRQRRIRADYLIAADGQRSPIRERLGITRTGPGVIRHTMSIVFDADLSAYMSRRAILWFVRNSRIDGGGAFITTTAVPNRWLLAVDYDPDTEGVADFDDDRCVRLIRTAVGDDSLSVSVKDLTPWAQGLAVADEYRRGRVFLAGDSAHVWSPTGGIGANTGIQDCYGLAWRLAAVIHGWAGETILDSYHVERHPVAQALVELTEERQTHRTGDNPENDRTDDLLWTFGQRYHSAATLDAPHDTVFGDTLDLHAQPGTRAPHLWVDQDGDRISTIDLFGRGLVLLTGPDGLAWTDAATTVTETTPIPLVGYRVGPEAELRDIDGVWTNRYRLDDDGAVLVRPDGYVAWRHPGGTDDPASALNDALRRLLGTPGR